MVTRSGLSDGGPPWGLDCDIVLRFLPSLNDGTDASLSMELKMVLVAASIFPLGFLMGIPSLRTENDGGLWPGRHRVGLDHECFRHGCGDHPGDLRGYAFNADLDTALGSVVLTAGGCLNGMLDEKLPVHNTV